jgi:hypothetical protein
MMTAQVRDLVKKRTTARSSSPWPPTSIPTYGASTISIPSVIDRGAAGWILKDPISTSSSIAMRGFRRRLAVFAHTRRPERLTSTASIHDGVSTSPSGRNVQIITFRGGLVGDPALSVGAWGDQSRSSTGSAGGAGRPQRRESLPKQQRDGSMAVRDAGHLRSINLIFLPTGERQYPADVSRHLFASAR